jgi:hypothetical protein
MAEASKSTLKTCEVMGENKLQDVLPHVNITRIFLAQQQPTVRRKGLSQHYEE